MSIQAVLFGISDWSTNDARKWLKNHNVTPIKNVHKTANFLRYRIKAPKYDEKCFTFLINRGYTSLDLFNYRIKPIQTKPLIKLILEY